MLGKLCLPAARWIYPPIVGGTTLYLLKSRTRAEGLLPLAVYSRRAPGGAIAVAAEAELVFIADRVHGAAGGVYSPDPSQSPAGVGSSGRGSVSGMGIVAIYTFCMARGVYQILCRVVDSGGAGHWVDAAFIKLSLDIFASYISIMAGIAITLLNAIVQQPLGIPCGVRPMTVFAAIGGHGGSAGMGPGVSP